MEGEGDSIVRLDMVDLFYSPRTGDGGESFPEIGSLHSTTWPMSAMGIFHQQSLEGFLIQPDLVE